MYIYIYLICYLRFGVCGGGYLQLLSLNLNHICASVNLTSIQQSAAASGPC